MKKLTASILCFSVLNFLAAALAAPPDAEQLTKAAQEAFLNLDSVKFSQIVAVDGTPVSTSTAGISFADRLMYLEQKQGPMSVTVYFVNDTLYAKLPGRGWNILDDPAHPAMQTYKKFFDKRSLATIGNVDYQKSGLALDYNGKEEIQGGLCHKVSYHIVDKEKFIEAAQDQTTALQEFMPEQDRQMFREHMQMVIDRQDEEAFYTQWIRESDNRTAKIEYRMPLPPDNELGNRIENETYYYDYNEPISIDVPEISSGAE
ncbi:MAG: hypothetical protein GF333_06540 [Candidatus Omnitrophica bacterium]|nr:hypothetical protein [Candidatus Omnitrophota bacterium]